MIDLHALDNFARDHLHFEANCSRCYQNPSLSTPPTDAEILCGLDRIRTLVMHGSIDDACEICEKLCSHPIEDPRIQLNVRIHKLFELIHVAENTPREKTALYNEALQNALRYSQQLADFALNAFPEAYALFTESMMLFAYPERTSTADAIREHRTKLADDLVSLTRMTVCARESCLSFLIRYLLLIYLQFKSPVVTPGEDLDPLEELIQELLEWGRAPVDRTARIVWKTDGSRPTKFSHRGEYKEADVQTLPERVNISRQESIESLRFTGGDVFAALRNELGRVLVNRQRFRIMVVEYCAARGLQVFETAKTAATSGARGHYPRLSDDRLRVVVPEQLLCPSSLAMFPMMCKLHTLAKDGDFDAFLEEIRRIDPKVLENAPLLDFRIGQCQAFRYIQQRDYHAAIDVSQQKLGPLAKRYPEFLPLLTETITLLVYANDLKSVEDCPRRSKPDKETGEAPATAGTDPRPRRARAGDKRIRHTRLRDDPAAAGCVNSRTGSDVLSFEDFLTDAFRSVTENVSLESITSEAYNAYEQKFKEPQLVQLLKRLIPTHEEWQTQNMMTDRFTIALGIDEIRGLLQDGNSSVLDSARGAYRESDIGSDVAGTDDAHAQGLRTLGGRLRDEQRENTVLTLMEFLAMSRAEALAVLRNHPHAENAQTILDSLLGTML